MKELLLQYAQCNTWANKQIIDVLLTLDEEQLDKEIISSFSSLRTTVYHTWSAEYVWLQRLQLAEHPVWIQGEFNGTFAEACADWQQTSDDLLQFVNKQYNDKALEHVLQYHDLTNTMYKTPVYQVLTHVFNHSTSHRGQLITMLRQAGVKEIPPTDFIFFVRKRLK